MAIADDAISPRNTTLINSTGTTITSASFTPPNNSLLVAMVGSCWNTVYTSAPANPQWALSDSLGGTWTKVSESNAGSGQSAASGLYYRQVVSGAAMTVSAHWNNTDTAPRKTVVMCVAVLTGAATSGTIVGSLFTGGSSAAGNTWATKSVTTTTVGSLPLIGVSYDTDGRTLTANGNTTQYIQNIDINVGCSHMFGRAANLTTTPGSLSIGWSISGTGTQDGSAEVVEVMPAAPGGGPIRTVGVYQAVMRASVI